MEVEKDPGHRPRLFIATGFIVGPTLFGVLATRFDRPVALLVAAAPALLAALVPPASDDRSRSHETGGHREAPSA